MLSFACNGAAFRAVTVATTVAIALAMVSPSAADPGPPTKLGGEVVVNTHPNGSQLYPEATRRPDGKWIVVWVSRFRDGSGDGVYMQLFNADRTKNGGEVRVNTITQNDQEQSRVAAAADNSFAVVWTSKHSSPHRIQSQRFDSSGGKVGGEFTVSAGASEPANPHVAYLNNGDVVYCWFDVTTKGVMIRRYDPNFAPLSAAVEVDTITQQGSILHPRVAALTGGGFVVVYHTVPNGTSWSAIFGQLYSSSGTKVGSTFQVSSNTATGGRKDPDVAALPHGGFIVAWTGLGQWGRRRHPHR